MHLTRNLNSLKGKRLVRDLTDLYYKKSWLNQGRYLNADRSLLPERLANNNVLIERLKNAEEFNPSKVISSTQENSSDVQKIQRLKFDNESRVYARMKELLNFKNEIKESIDDGLLFLPKYRISLGLPQVSVLTNTKVDFDIPDVFSNTVEKLVSSKLVTDPNHSFRRIVERTIMHANVWDTEETKWPKRYQEELKHLRLSRECLIHPDNATNMIIAGLFKAISSNFLNLTTDSLSAGKIEEILETTTLLSNRKIRTFFRRNVSISHNDSNKYRIFVDYIQPLAIISSKKSKIISQFPSHDSIKFYFENCQDNLGPMDPAIDMVRNQYLEGDLIHSDGWSIPDEKPARPNVPLMTCNYGYLNSNCTDLLPPEFRASTPGQRQSIAIIYAYAQAISMARRRYGNDFVDSAMDNGPDLEEPIAFDVIGSADGIVFDIISYQLNTLRNETREKANMAWIHSADGFKLYNKVIPKRLRYKYARYLDLNMSVVARLVAAYSRAVL